MLVIRHVTRRGGVVGYVGVFFFFTRGRFDRKPRVSQFLVPETVAGCSTSERRAAHGVTRPIMAVYASPKEADNSKFVSYKQLGRPHSSGYTIYIQRLDCDSRDPRVIFETISKITF